MDIALIGSTGHTGYVFGGIADDRKHSIIGIAAGSEGEDVSGLMANCTDRGHQPRLFDDPVAMLDETKPDVAVVACQFGDLTDRAIAALERGCHVFMEKPVAIELDALDRLKETHRRAGTHLAAMLNLRYEGAFLAAWRAVHDGQIGQVRLMTAQKSYRLGTRADFYKARATYGGTIPWVGIHAIDLFEWFAGRSFRSVYARHSTIGNHDHGELEATALCHFTMDDEVLAGANIDYLRPAKAETHGDDRIRIAGTDGVIEVRDGKARLTSNRAGGTVILKAESTRTLFGDFLLQVEGRGECLVSAEDSFASTDAVLRARLSADEKRVISF